jgi:hypothetical protein
MWETLSKTKNGHEKLAWDGVESEEDIFFTPPKSPTKDDASLSVMVDRTCHLKVYGYVHAEIVKQLIDHQDLWASSRCSTIKHFGSKKGQTCKKIIKVGGRKHHIIPLILNSNDGQRSSHVLPHSKENGVKSKI